MTNPIRNAHRPPRPIGDRPLPPPAPPVEVQAPKVINIDEKLEGYKNDFATGKITAEDFVNKMKEIGITVTMSEDGTTATFKYNGKEYSITNNVANSHNEPVTQEYRNDYEDGSYCISIIQDGRKIREEYYDNTGKLNRVLDYNEQGQWYRQTSYDEQGNIKGYFEITFHENGKDATWRDMDANGNLLTEFIFDEQGRMLFKKDGNGNILSEQVYNEDGSYTRTDYENGKIKAKMELDKNDRWTLIQWYNEEGTLDNISEFVYFEDGSYCRTDKTPDGKITTVSYYDDKGERVYFANYNNTNVVTKNVVAEADRLFYRLEQGDLSALEELKSIGAEVKEFDGIIEISFEGITRMISTSASPEYYENISKVHSITQNFYFGVTSFEECCRQLEELGAELTRNGDGSVSFIYKGEWGSIASGLNPMSAGECKNCTGADYTILKELGLTDE